MRFGGSPLGGGGGERGSGAGWGGDVGRALGAGRGSGAPGSRDLCSRRPPPGEGSGWFAAGLGVGRFFPRLSFFFSLSTGMQEFPWISPPHLHPVRALQRVGEGVQANHTLSLHPRWAFLGLVIGLDSLEATPDELFIGFNYSILIPGELLRIIKYL